MLSTYMSVTEILFCWVYKLILYFCPICETDKAKINVGIIGMEPSLSLKSNRKWCFWITSSGWVQQVEH